MNPLHDDLEAARHADATSLRHCIAAAGLDWIVPQWAAPQSVNAFTTTRSGEQQRHLAAMIPSQPVWLKQVHGAEVATLDAEMLERARASPPVADAAVTRLRGVVCGVATADCLPVVFADRGGETIGVAHAGWRGLAAGVLEQTVAALDRLGADPHDLLVWFGPAIGPRAFEVGRDVFDAFCERDHDMEACFVPYRQGKWLADIYALARHRLARCGVRDITGGGWCTYSEPARFHSYRRERNAGRMLTVAWLAPDD